MALNIETFKTRALTAVIFVVVMLAGLLWNGWSFLFLFTLIHFGCWIEYQRLISAIYLPYGEISAFHRYGVMIAGYAIMLLMTAGHYFFVGIPLNEWGWWILLVCAFGVPVSEILFSKNFSLTSMLLSLAGLIYISFSWGCMMQLRFDTSLHEGWVLPIILIASIWINDTMAYLVGSFIGKTPLSKISPKKTWEGTIGGAILCVAAVTLCGYYWFGASSYTLLLVISAIAAIAGTVGDLIESKLKRLAGVKDSGQIMPGHGGFLDRFDSLLLATPFVWIYLQLLRW